MSLTIFPAYSASLTQSYVLMDHNIERWGQKPTFWFGDASPFRKPESDVKLTKTREGFIRTSAPLSSEFDGPCYYHNCDNLQLSGEVSDRTFIGSIVPPYIGFDTLVSGQGKVTDSVSNDMYIAWAVLTGQVPDRFVSVWAYVAPGYNAGTKCVANFVRYVLISGRWFRLLLVKKFSGINSLDSLLKLIPALRDQLVTYTDGSSSEISNPYFYGVSKMQYEYVAKQYLFDSFEWSTPIDEFTDLSGSKLYPYFAELHYRAACKIPVLSENAFAFSRDIVGFLTEVKSLFSALRGGLNPKKVADVFLSLKWGPPQTLSDVRKVISDSQRNPVFGVSATQIIGEKFGEVKLTSTIRLKNRALSQFEQIDRILHYLDADLTPSNIWELIPFSFVVDWVTDIDNQISRLDVRKTLEFYDVVSVFDTYVYTGAIQASLLHSGYDGSVTFRRYCRKCSRDASFPLVVHKDEPQTSSHWFEGLALMIQRLH